MKTEDFLLRVVALRDAQKNALSLLHSDLKEAKDLEIEIDDIISRILTKEEKLIDESLGILNSSLIKNIQEISELGRKMRKAQYQTNNTSVAYEEGSCTIDEFIPIESESREIEKDFDKMLKEFESAGFLSQEDEE